MKEEETIENLRVGGVGDIEKMYPETYKLARQFHQIYEENAPFFGYITNEKTREFDHESTNARLMAFVCHTIISEETCNVREDERNVIEAFLELRNKMQ